MGSEAQGGADLSGGTVGRPRVGGGMGGREGRGEEEEESRAGESPCSFLLLRRLVRTENLADLIT